MNHQASITTLLNGNTEPHLITGHTPPLTGNLWLVIGAFLLVRLIFALLLGPGYDEAYYHSYSLRPSLSYYDHPPLVAFFAGLFPKLTGVHNQFTIRLGVVLLFTVSNYFYARLARLFLDEKETIFSLVLLNSLPIFLACAGVMVLPDGPMSFFWILSLFMFWKMLHQPYRTAYWIIAGLFCGLAMLGKYHGVGLIGLFFGYLLLYRRDLLLRPGPYLLIGFAILAFSPVIIWNWQNSFTSFLYQGQKAIGTQLSIDDFFESLGGQALYLTPFFFFQAFYVIAASFRSGFPGGDQRYRFFLFFGSVPVLFFIFVSLFREVLPHWTLAGFIILMIPLAHLVARQWSQSQGWRNFYKISLTITAALYLILVGHARFGILHLHHFEQKGWLPKGVALEDTTLDTYGWQTLDDYLKNNELNPEDYFLFTAKWYMSGEVELATEGRFEVFCFSKTKANAYQFWAEGVDLKGKNGLFITTDRHFTSPRKKYPDYFETIEGPEVIEVFRGGVVSKQIFVYRCSNLLKNYQYR